METTIYVRSNEFDGDVNDAPVIAEFTGTQEECEAWFEENYGSNDFSYSHCE